MSPLDTKPPYASTGVLGALVALLGSYGPVWMPLVGITEPELQTQAMQLIVGPGGVVALIGRLTATRRLY